MLTQPFQSRKKWNLETLPFEIIFGLAICISLFIIVLRAGNLFTIWVDEYYTVMMINESFQDIWYLTALDAHPPLYYFLIKIWFMFFDFIGVGETLILGRSLGIIWMFAGVFFARWQLTHLMDRNRANVVCALILLCPGWYDVIDDMRNYALVMPLVLVAGIAWLDLIASRNLKKSEGQILSTVNWIIYTAALTVAWWMHLLTGLLILWFGLLWLYFVLRDIIAGPGLKFNNYLVGGIISHTLLLLFYSPWIIQVQHQFHYLQNTNLHWMTKPTVYHLFMAMLVTTLNGRDIYLWLVDADPFFVLITAATLLFTIVYGVWAMFREPDPGKSNRVLIFAIFAVWIGFVYSLWWLTLNDIVTIFHAPRYPLIVSPLIIAVLGMTVFGWSGTEPEKVRQQSKNLTLKSAAILLPLVTIFSLSIVTTFSIKYIGYVSNLASLKNEWRNELPEEGETVWLLQDYMEPYVLHEKVEYDIRLWKNLSHLDITPGDDLNLFFITLWTPVSEYDLAMLLFLKAEAKRFENMEFLIPENSKYGILTVDEITSEQIALFLARDIPPSDNPWPRIPENAVRELGARYLDRKKGWSLLEMDDHRNIFRWGDREEMVIDIDQPLEAGKYVWKMMGFSLEKNERETELAVTIAGETSTFELKEGAFDLSIPFEVKQGQELSEIILHHELFVPFKLHSDSEDGRPLSILYNGSWIEPRSD